MKCQVQELPDRIKKLPVDERGYPVPRFVAWFDEHGNPTERGVGKPDQRIASAEMLFDCLRNKVCWICGEPLEWRKAFIGGPSSVKHRAFADGPMHIECAEFSVKVCPHLSHPNAKRREGGNKDKANCPEGLDERPIDKVAVYITRGYRAEKIKHGILWRPDAPVEVRWFSSGERITVEE